MSDRREDGYILSRGGQAEIDRNARAWASEYRDRTIRGFKSAKSVAGLERFYRWAEQARTKWEPSWLAYDADYSDWQAACDYSFDLEAEFNMVLAEKFPDQA